jgi:HK97 family phage major capsid protein
MAEIELKQVNDAIGNLNSAFEEFKRTNDERLKEIEAKGAADPVTEQKLAKIDADITKANEIAEQAALAVKRSQRIVTDEKGEKIDLDAKAFNWASTLGKRRGSMVQEYTAADMDEYKSAFGKYLRSDEKMLEAVEAKALSVGSDPDGGYVVHPDMNGRVVERVFDTSPMRAYASIQVVSTDALEGLHDVDEASASWVEETGSRAETNTPELKRWRIPTHEMYANPAATQKILDDAEISIEQWLANKVADKFARTEATAFVTGNGVGKPRGFLDYGDWTTAGTYQLGAIEQFDSGANGAFVAAPNGGDVLITALYSLKQQYRNNATWFMNRSVGAAVRKLKDSDGAYIWQPGIAAGQPATLLGYPTATFEDMPDLATGSLSIAVGDMRAAYQIVDRMGIRVLRDPYSNKPYVHFYTTKRVGGDVVDFDALKIINFQA